MRLILSLLRRKTMTEKHIFFCIKTLYAIKLS